MLVWNNEVDTIECMESFDRLVPGPEYRADLVFIDNNSRQEIFEAIEKHVRSRTWNHRIVTIRNRENLGYTGATTPGSGTPSARATISCSS